MEKLQLDILLKLAESTQKIAYIQEAINEKVDDLCERVRTCETLSKADHSLIQQTLTLLQIIDKENKRIIELTKLIQELPNILVTKIEEKVQTKTEKFVFKHFGKIIGTLIGILGIMATYIVSQGWLPWLH